MTSWRLSPSHDPTVAISPRLPHPLPIDFAVKAPAPTPPWQSAFQGLRGPWEELRQDWARYPRSAKVAIAELGLPADRTLAAPGDLTDPAAARAVAGAVEAAFGRIDVVAHLVGGYAGGTEVAALDHDEVRRLLESAGAARRAS